MKKNEFVIITNKGIAGSRGFETSDVLAILLDSFLQLWNDDKFEIDIVEAADRMMDVLVDMREDKEELTLDDVLKYLFSDDEDEEDNG